MSAADRWLTARLDPVPEALAVRLDGDEEGEELVETLLLRGLGALSDALGPPGPDREAAYRLLVADAYLTYACEAAVEADDPEAALEEILGRVGERDT